MECRNFYLERKINPRRLRCASGEMSQQFVSCEYNTEDEVRCIEMIYPKVTKISIDNGILEKAKNVYVIPADLGWSDLGSWTSVYENYDKDENENTVIKTAFLYITRQYQFQFKTKTKLSGYRWITELYCGRYR